MLARQIVCVVLVALSVGACKKKTPPVAAPAPAAADTSALMAARAGARADSIAAAANARREREAGTRAISVARAKEALSEIVYFEYDSEQLTAEAEEKLRNKAIILRANPGVNVIVAGHADERGSTEYNLTLGQRRAEAVKTFVEGYGISGDRVSTISFGKERPLLEGTGESVWSRNRRAEFTIASGEVSVAPPEVS